MEKTQKDKENNISFAQLQAEYDRLEKLYNALFQELQNCRQELKTLKGDYSKKGEMKLTFTKKD